MSNICELFFKLATKEPDKVAIIFGDEKISYSDLANLANNIAASLYQIGIRPGSLVGINLKRSSNLIAAIIAILKVGAGYVPLDVSFPAKRIEYILKNSRLNFVITEKEAQNINLIFSTIKSLRPIYIEDLVSFQENKEMRIMPGSVAYVIYTSGSTGLPKGVVMNHRALNNLITWQGKVSKVSNGITLQYAPISFDVSFQEIFSTLSFGGTLVLCSEETRRNPETFLELIISKKISRIFIPFIFLHQLAEVVKEKQPPSDLREVITAGEQLKITPAIRSFFRSLSNCKLINQYGPTETHVVTSYEVIGDSQQWPFLPPIGKPISNVSVYIFDNFLKEVPSNEIGELYIGGPCLANGYLNNPTLTQKSFVQHPLSHERIYKTGDLVRRLSDGNLEFVGRTDHQVKIRGYRIELGEIEAVLAEHPNVKECVVDVGSDILGHNKLIAYIVVRQKYTQTQLKPIFQINSEWYSFLKEKLPDYMIPSTFIIVSSLPLTPTGKIDRKSLSKLSTQRSIINTSLGSPRDETELKIAEIWKKALQLDEVGINDNFFELGGNSLLATYIQQKMSKTFPVKIDIVDLFQYPTIRLLAEQIKKRKDNKGYKVSNRKIATLNKRSVVKRIKNRKRYEK